MVVTCHENKIDKIGKMIWPQFPTKVLQIWLRQDKCHYTHQKSSLEQSSPIQDQIHDIINPKCLKKEREKNLKVFQEQLTDETRHIIQLIHLKGWARYSEHEYIIQLSRKGSCPSSVQSNAEFRSQDSLYLNKFRP